MSTAPNFCTSKITDTAGLVIKIDVNYYFREDQLLTVTQINDPEILLRDISEGHGLFLVQSLREYEFDLARRTLLAKSASMANLSEAFECAR